MTDIRQMTAVEVLAWLAAAVDENYARLVSPDMALACINVGLTDTEQIEGMGTGVRAEQIGALGRLGPIEPPLTSAEINMIARIGYRVLAEDRDNADDWWLFVERLEQTREKWSGRKNNYLGEDWTRDLIGTLLDAERGPRYAQDILDRAIAAGIMPNSYGWEVEPEIFADLAAAGVRNATQIAEWRRALGERYTPARMLMHAANGIASSVAVAASEQGIPEFEWRKRLSGIPAGWVTASHERRGFPRPDRVAEPRVPAELPKGADGPWSLDDLGYLARHGWDGINGQGYGLTSALYGHGSRSGGTLHLSIADARRLADTGLKPNDAARWKAALNEGRYRDDDGNPPPLDTRAGVPDICALHDAGVRVSHLGTWRQAGCRSAGDVLAAVRAGVTPTRAKELIERDGRNLGKYSGGKLGFGSLDELLRAHERDAA